MNGNSGGVYRLCFKNIPQNMKPSDLTKLCSEYGKVINCTGNSQKTTYKFVDFASWRDMQNAYEGIKNSGGIVVDIAKATKKEPEKRESDKKQGNYNTSHADENAQAFADISISPNTTDNKLIVKEERNFNSTIKKTRKCVACHGSANKKCQRCGDYYCSFECQLKDWSSHRYICIPMPNLIDVDDDVSCDTVSENHSNNENNCKNDFGNISNKKKTNQSSIDTAVEKKNFDYSMEIRNQYTKQNQNKDIGDKKVHDQSFDYGMANRNQYTKQNQNKDVGDKKVYDQSTNYGVVNRTQDTKQNKEIDYEKNHDQFNHGVPNRNHDATHDKKVDDQKAANQSINYSIVNGNKDTKKIKEAVNHSYGIANQDTKKIEEVDDKKVGNQNIDRDIINKKDITKRSAEIDDKKVIHLINFAEFPPNRSHVVITEIFKTNVLYLRSIDCDAEYTKILQAIHLQGENSKQLKKLPVNGEIFITDYDGSYYRVVVQSVENENVTVLFIDFGNIEIKKITELRVLPSELFDLKCYTHSFYLKNVPDVNIPSSVFNYINSYIDCFDQKLEIIYDEKKKQKDKLEVELKNIDTGEILNKRIVELIENSDIVDKTDSQEIDFFTKNNIEHKLIPDSENAEIFVLDNSFIEEGILNCVLRQDIGPLFDFCQSITDYGKASNQAYKPRKSELCVVYCELEGNWYRAECIDVDNDYCRILFTDFGNERKVHISQIRKFSKKFLRPCETNKCMIAGLPSKLSEAAIEKINSVMPLNEHVIVSKISRTTSKHGIINLLHIPKIINILKTEQLI